MRSAVWAGPRGVHRDGEQPGGVPTAAAIAPVVGNVKQVLVDSDDVTEVAITELEMAKAGQPSGLTILVATQREPTAALSEGMRRSSLSLPNRRNLFARQPADEIRQAARTGLSTSGTTPFATAVRGAAVPIVFDRS